MRVWIALPLLVLTFGWGLRGQPKEPIYQVNVISRTLQAVNYGYKTELPVQVSLEGTVLLPDAKGKATVHAKGGVTEVDLKVSGLKPPGRFGPRRLTYVLWAITPEGRPMNMGELITNHANAAKLQVSIPLQSFALIVTAEPYFAVTNPGGVIVLQNTVPAGAARVERVQATEELFPKQEFLYDIDAGKAAEGPLVSMSEYEATVALYQAQGALQLARSEGVDRLAPDSFGKAQQLYQEALSLKGQKGGDKRMTMLARQSAQATEDARSIAKKRANGEVATR